MYIFELYSCPQAGWVRVRVRGRVRVRVNGSKVIAFFDYSGFVECLKLSG